MTPQIYPANLYVCNVILKKIDITKHARLLFSIWSIKIADNASCVIHIYCKTSCVTSEYLCQEPKKIV